VRAPRTAVVTDMTIAALAWRDAIGPCDVFPTEVDRTVIEAYGVVIIEAAGVDVVRRLLPVSGTRSVWIHGGITPAQLRAARAVGVELVLHREAGLQPLLDALRRPRKAPMITLLGAASEAETAIGSLSLEEVLVLRLLSRGASVAEVRRTTGYTANQVERIRQSILVKLGVQTTGEAMGRALSLGLIRTVGPRNPA